MIRVDVMQAWKDGVRRVLNRQVGGVIEEGFTAGSTEYSFIVDTPKSPDEVQDLLFETGMNWAKVRPWLDEEI